MSICKQMTHQEIAEKIEDFARSARQAKEAGFDSVEIHSGHGYLMSQFLSPWTNHRKDKYGGSLDSRLRFETEGASALVPSCGLTSRTPLYMMRGNVPMQKWQEIKVIHS
ncbi:MAG: hypothetical protein HOC20_10850 [Chloroflexi bacterium]|nr:hypothetical protein [Chloroflexota bacterium]